MHVCLRCLSVIRTVDASAVAGTTVYTITVTDPENDDVQISMTQNPNSNILELGET
jgi:hypothetical protein